MNEERTLSTIQELQAHVQETERELAETKRTVNVLCKRIGRDPIYKDTEASSSVAATRSDEFYNKALASVVRTILERRGAANLGAASVDVIYAAMKAGGYMFNAKNDSTAKTALAVSLAKNTYTFHKLPNGDFGMADWYDLPAKARANGRSAAEPGDEPEAESPAPAEKPDGLKEPYKNEFAGTAEATEGKAGSEGKPRRKATAKAADGQQ